MAQNLERANGMNLSIFRSFIFCVALVCPLFHRVSGTECGMTNFLVNERILKGNATLDAEWPFIAALYHTISGYFCGGTIISQRHVLTAAHCIQTKGVAQRLSVEDIVVRLGAYNLTAKDEKEVVIRNVTHIHVHEDWNVNKDDYDADIAILELSDNVTFTDYIRPICLPKDDDDVVVDTAFINIVGIIVGWGIDRNETHEPIPKSSQIRALNDTHCFLTYKQTVFIASTRTFCGIGDGTPNRGDSGGGFFVDKGLVWVQYGIISAIRTNDARKVVTTAAVYTNVKRFRSWIVERIGEWIVEERVEERKEEPVEKPVDERIIKVNFSCSYSMRQVYQCQLLNFYILAENIVVESITGSHHGGKSDDDVAALRFVSGTMLFLPSGIGKHFRNLHFMVVNEGFNTGIVKRTNLQDLEKLTYLKFLKNDIEVLAFDTLWDLPLLLDFALIENKLEVLDGRTFEKNLLLKNVNLERNRLKYLPENLFTINHRSLSSVSFVRNRLKNIEMDFSTLFDPSYIKLSDNPCINACYKKPSVGLSCTTDNIIVENLSELQNQIMRNCHTPN